MGKIRTREHLYAQLEYARPTKGFRSAPCSHVPFLLTRYIVMTWVLHDFVCRAIDMHSRAWGRFICNVPGARRTINLIYRLNTGRTGRCLLTSFFNDLEPLGIDWAVTEVQAPRQHPGSLKSVTSSAMSRRYCSWLFSSHLHHSTGWENMMPRSMRLDPAVATSMASLS